MDIGSDTMTWKINASVCRLLSCTRAHLPVWPPLGYTISVCSNATRSSQPCTSPGSLNLVPASAGVKAGISPLLGGR